MAAKNWPSGIIPPNGNPAESVPSVSTSDGTNENDSEAGADDDPNDAEGVWSPDIEQSFQEALAIYPPCGRRKIILSDEGKMYGRNELIARYIKVRTGKTRTRKQVSSHIQVLARRKSKDIHSQLKHCNPMAKERALQGLNALSSSQIVSASTLRPPGMSFAQHPAGMHGMNASGLFSHYPAGIPTAAHPSMDWARPPLSSNQPFPPGWSPNLYPPPSSTINTSPNPDKELPPVDIKPAINERPWLGRSISSDKLRVCAFTAFYDPEHDETNRKASQSASPSRHILVEIGNYSPSDPPLEDVEIRQIYDKFPTELGGLQDLYEKGPHNAFFLVKFWADLSADFKDETSNTLYAVDCRYESCEQMNIICSTKVCSFGRQVVEKVETQYGKLSSEGRFIYTIDSSKMCDYMITFICRLRQLSDNTTMNSVLENFTILQVIQNKETLETLLCIAMVFEVATQQTGRQHNTYRLIRE